MSSIELVPLSEEELARLKTVYTPVSEREQCYIRTIPGHVTVFTAFEKFRDSFKNWQVRKEDVYVLTFPKNGTTWTQELVWLLQNDCNFDEATTVPLEKRSPFMDFSVYIDFLKKDLPQLLQGDFLKTIEDMPSPRLLKSHFHFCLLPDDLMEKSKAVICLRNPKDTVVSYYHHEKIRRAHRYEGDFPTYFDLFMDNLLLYSSYFEYTKEAWKLRNHPNVCLLFFEDMKKDLASSVRKVAKFLGKQVAKGKVEELVDHLSFKKMKNNPAVNRKHEEAKKYIRGDGHFMRKGEVGDWKKYFTDEMNKRMDEAVEKHFKPIGLEFQYD